MSRTPSPEAVPATTDRMSDGRFATGNRGGPGNPFARQTAALRAYLINQVTERDLQDILDVLLLNAKAGHLPTIKFLFAYLLGKPKPVVEPDLLDLQEMQMLQQAAQAPQALETLCEQLPPDFQVQLARCAQADNATVAVHSSAQDQAAAVPPPPSPNGDCGAPHGAATVEAPSPNGFCGAADVVASQQPPSPNGKMQRPPPLAGFACLDELCRAVGSLSPP